MNIHYLNFYGILVFSLLFSGLNCQETDLPVNKWKTLEEFGTENSPIKDYNFSEWNIIRTNT